MSDKEVILVVTVLNVMPKEAHAVRVFLGDSATILKRRIPEEFARRMDVFWDIHTDENGEGGRQALSARAAKLEKEVSERKKNLVPCPMCPPRGDGSKEFCCTLCGGAGVVEVGTLVQQLMQANTHLDAEIAWGEEDPTPDQKGCGRGPGDCPRCDPMNPKDGCVLCGGTGRCTHHYMKGTDEQNRPLCYHCHQVFDLVPGTKIVGEAPVVVDPPSWREQIDADHARAKKKQIAVLDGLSNGLICSGMQVALDDDVEGVCKQLYRARAPELKQGIPVLDVDNMEALIDGIEATASIEGDEIDPPLRQRR